MDDDIRQKFAPRRNKRYAHLRHFNDEASWANTLDWRNEYDFYRISRSIIERLDSDYREKVGLRVDQLAMASEEVEKMFRTCRDLYQEDSVFQARGIYVFLHFTMSLWLGGKTDEALNSRREIGERINA
jgi:hypothetical protein